ncbi:TPA: hypothetical protein OWR08_001551 [Staphylococcus aureus]|nr:hypothetical protein [Staphylococcus aureus]
MKIFIGTMLTFLFVCSLIVCGFFAYKIYFPADAKNKSEVPNHMQENTHNINNNGSEANENFINKKNRIENIQDKQKAYALMSIPRHNLPESEKAIYDKVISTAIQNINNGVGNEEDFRLKEIYDGIQSVQPQ